MNRKDGAGPRRGFLTTFYVATGLRPSELRLARLEDLDVRRWRFYVRTPKGAGVWGENRTVAVMPNYRDNVLAYLEERKDLLRFYGKDQSIYLIPQPAGRHRSTLQLEPLPGAQEGGPGDIRGLLQAQGLQAHLRHDVRGDGPKPLGGCIGTARTLECEHDPELLCPNLAESAGSRLEKAWDGNGEDTKVL